MPDSAGQKDAGHTAEQSASTPQPPRAALKTAHTTQDERDAQAIPGLGDLRAVAPQITINNNIGVLGDIHGGTIKATGQASTPSLGEAISQAGPRFGRSSRPS